MKCRRMLVVGVAVMLLAATAVAQNGSDKVELTGQYSYLRFNPSLSRANNRSLNGGGLDFSFFLTPMFGIKADYVYYGSTDYTTVLPVTVSTKQGIIPAGTYTANGTMKTYTFGPIVKGRFHRFEPFGQILFGVSHVNAYANLSKVVAQTPGATLHVQGTQDPFTMVVGGGVDIPVSRLIAVRLADIDYVLTRLTNPFTSTNNQNHFRYAGGVQFRFGGR
jgi:hypothetical protein